MSKRSRNLDQIQATPTSIRRAAAQRAAAEPRCCWPKCISTPAGDAPLCRAHLNLAAKIHKASADGVDLVWRTSVPTETPAPTKAPVDGFVYYLRSSGYIKIGWTADLQKRMKSYPPDSLLLAVEPGIRQVETRRHRQFSHHRTHGREWYTMAPSLMHHIAAVTSEHGQPAHVDFAAKPVGIPQPRQRQTIGRPSRGVRHVTG